MKEVYLGTKVIPLYFAFHSRKHERENTAKLDLILKNIDASSR